MKSKPRSTRTLPGRSSEFLLYGESTVRKIITFAVLYLAFEYQFGLPFVRLSWRGNIPGEQHMVSCRILMLSGQVEDFIGLYKPLVGIHRSDRSTAAIIWGKLKAEPVAK